MYVNIAKHISQPRNTLMYGIHRYTHSTCCSFFNIVIFQELLQGNIWVYPYVGTKKPRVSPGFSPSIEISRLHHGLETAFHGVRLACTRRAVGHDCGIVALQGRHHLTRAGHGLIQDMETYGNSQLPWNVVNSCKLLVK